MWDCAVDFITTHSVAIAATSVILFIIVSVLAYNGLFHRVVIERVNHPVGKLRVAYLFNTGPYKNCGPLFEVVKELAPNNPCLGIYYDDPNTTPAKELRYIVGAILNEGDEVDVALEKRMKGAGMGVVDFPPVVEAFCTNFPFRWMISILFAVNKVYPAMDRKMKEEGVLARPAIEIYDDRMIKFVMPIRHCKSYYVPEVLESKAKSI